MSGSGLFLTVGSIVLDMIGGWMLMRGKKTGNGRMMIWGGIVIVVANCAFL